MRTLIVAAHPDDEVLGCGGTIARLSETQDVIIAILGEGSTSRLNSRPSTPTKEVLDLARFAEKARLVLGAKELITGGLPDNRFDELPLIEVVKKVESIINLVNPDSVFTHHVGDLNVDHQVAARAVVTSTRPGASANSVREVISFEIPSSSEWAFGVTGEPFRPNLFVDITSTLDRKIQAMQCYETEMRPFPHPRSEDALRAIATVRGASSGMHAAEAFQVVRILR